MARNIVFPVCFLCLTFPYHLLPISSSPLPSAFSSAPSPHTHAVLYFFPYPFEHPWSHDPLSNPTELHFPSLPSLLDSFSLPNSYTIQKISHPVCHLSTILEFIPKGLLISFCRIKDEVVVACKLLNGHLYKGKEIGREQMVILQYLQAVFYETSTDCQLANFLFHLILVYLV